MSRMRVTRWLHSPLVSGPPVILCIVGAILVPTLVRYSLNGVITGCEFTPYVPFVLLSAIILRWWQAAVVALASAALFSGLMLGSGHVFADPCTQSAIALFLASSALMIGTVMLLRHAVAGLLSSPDETSNSVIFSMEKDQVWATLPGKGPPVCLGSHSNVNEMMEDFLAQNELARRLRGDRD